MKPQPPCSLSVMENGLWVKEIWLPSNRYGHLPIPPSVIYKADATLTQEADYDLVNRKWKSPRFMFRWASRITLEIVNVKVERLQNITDADVVAEGRAWAAMQEKILRYGIELLEA